MTNEVKNVPELRFPEFSEEWEDNLVGNIFEFKNGLNKGKEYFGYGIPIVNFKDVFHNRGIKSEYLNGKVDVSEKELQNYSVRKGDVFFTRTSEIIEEIGYPTVMMDEIPKAVFSGFVLRARPKKNSKLVDDKFKRYVFFTYSFRKEMITKSSITTRALTSGTAINKMKVIYPTSIEEQNKIGEFFSKLDRQIELEEQKLEKLEEQKKGYMQKIFSQELRFKDENGNEYPEWEEKTIKDVYKVTRGYVLARKLMSDSPNSINKYPVYSSQTSNNGLMGYYSDYLYQDAITWTTDGANAGSVSFRQGKFYCTNVCGVLLNELGNSNVCMAEMLNNIAFKYVSKVGNPKLMNNVMAMIKLKFPCLEEQQAISKFLIVFSEVIDNQNKKVELLKERKKGLLQKMFV